jgi:peptide/nickel transport system substrate-binding protein
VTAIASNADPDKQTAAVAQQQLEELGFDVELRNVSYDTLFSKFCGVPASGYSACSSAGWGRDFPDPQSLLEPTFKGAAILPQGNNNWSQLDEPEIDAAMARAAALPAGEGRTRAWAEINRMVVERAVAIPYVWSDAFQLASPDVTGVMNSYSLTWDLSFSSLNQAG